MSARDPNPFSSASRKLAALLWCPMNSANSSRGNSGGMSPTTDGTGSMRARVTRIGRRRQAGLNLVELLVVTTIAAILLGIGVPSFRYVTNSNRVASEINSLLGDMTVARSEAIKYGVPVTICPSTNATSCNGTLWTQGWIVFTDFNANGTVDAGTPNFDTVLRVQPAFSGTDTFTTTNFPDNYITFNRDGFATNLNTTSSTHGLFQLDTSPTNAQWRRCLEFQMVGQMTTEHGGQGNCPST
jgi:type IV fimbrial biogenesis protein FimT